MTIRGGGDPSQAWLPRRLREWARRPGTPPSMRMAASWSGLLQTPEYKTVGAISGAQWRVPLGSSRKRDRRPRA